jgi:hypothetical protein
MRVSNPCPEAVHTVGIVKNGFRSPLNAHPGSTVPRQNRSASWDGSAGVPHKVTSVPRIAIPSEVFRALTDSP